MRRPVRDRRALVDEAVPVQGLEPPSRPVERLRDQVAREARDRKGADTTVRFSSRRVRGLDLSGLAAEIERLGGAVDALSRPDGIAPPELGEGRGPAPAEGEESAGPRRRE
jgi:hypothetical protein